MCEGMLVAEKNRPDVKNIMRSTIGMMCSKVGKSTVSEAHIIPIPNPRTGVKRRKASNPPILFR